MRKLLILFAVLYSSLTYAGTVFTLTVNSSGSSTRNIYNTNVQGTINPQAGDTLDIPSTYGNIWNVSLENITGGTTTNPVVITCRTSNTLQIGGNGGYAFKINYSRNVKIVGLHFNGQNKAGEGFQASYDIHNIWLDYCTVKQTKGPGFFIKCVYNSGIASSQYPYTIDTPKITHCRADSTYTEGYYIGSTLAGESSAHVPAYVNGLVMLYDTAYYTGWDGTQVSSAAIDTMNFIYVRQAGYRDSSAQRSGITIQNNTKIRHRIGPFDIANGTGSGLFIFTRGWVPIDGITIDNVGTSFNEVGIYVDDKPVTLYSTPGAPYTLDTVQKLDLTNVTITNVAHQAVWIRRLNGQAASGSVRNLYYNSVGNPAITDNGNNTIVLVGPGGGSIPKLKYGLLRKFKEGSIVDGTMLLKFANPPFGIDTIGNTMRFNIGYGPNMLTDSIKLGILGGSTVNNYGLSSPNGYSHKMSAWWTGLTSKHTYTSLGTNGYNLKQLLPTSMGGTAGANLDAIMANHPNLLIVDEGVNWSGSYVADSQMVYMKKLFNYAWNTYGVLTLFDHERLPGSYNSTQKSRIKDLIAKVPLDDTLKFISNYGSYGLWTINDSITSGLSQGDQLHFNATGTSILAANVQAFVKNYLSKTNFSRYYIDTSATGTGNWGLWDSTTSNTKTYARRTGYYRMRAKTPQGDYTPYSITQYHLASYNPFTILKFAFSKTAATVTSGYINVFGDPYNTVPSFTDASTGITIASTGTTNWNNSFGSSNAQNGYGQQTTDGYGYAAFDSIVAANFWYNYTDTFNAATPKYQVVISGLDTSFNYKLTLLASRSNANSATAPRTTNFNIKGRSAYTQQSIAAFQNTHLNAIFSAIRPANDGTLKIALNPPSSGGGLFAYLNAAILVKDTVSTLYDTTYTNVAKFNLSKTTATVSGWTNLVGDPISGTAPSVTNGNSITAASTGNTNWNGTFGTSNAHNGNGQGTDDGGGFYFPSAAIANYWYNYTDAYSSGSPKYQLQVTGLDTSKLYRIILVGSRSNASSATAPRKTDYNVLGATLVTAASLVNPTYTASTFGAYETFQNTSKAVAAFVKPDSTGKIQIAINKLLAGTGGSFGYLNAFQVDAVTITPH